VRSKPSSPNLKLLGAIAEFEKDLIKERTQAGLKAARARGRKGGRPKKMDAQMVEMATAQKR
jgi:DNA invertase Pin-like site-specific DNA recombinase